jgi:hypothetical protein
MTRIPRICLVAALSFVLLAAAVPAAHARTLTKQQSSHSVIGSLLDATLAWVSHLVTGTQHGRSIPGTKTIHTSGSGSGTGTGTGYIQPMCGSTLDPNGHCGGTGG